MKRKHEAINSSTKSESSYASLIRSFHNHIPQSSSHSNQYQPYSTSINPIHSDRMYSRMSLNRQSITNNDYTIMSVPEQVSKDSTISLYDHLNLNWQVIDDESLITASNHYNTHRDDSTINLSNQNDDEMQNFWLNQSYKRKL